MANLLRTKFAGLLRGLLHQLDDREPLPSQRPAAAAASMATAAPLPASVAQPPRPMNPDEIELPLAPIIAGLPIDLRAKLMSVPAAGAMICLPIETIMGQLAFGAVKISFGELRQLAPHIFANSGGEHDNRPVNLPLNEILTRLNPSLLARRTGQKIEVADEVSGPFGGQGRGVTFTTQPLKPVALPPTPESRADRPAVSMEAPLPATPIVFRPPPTSNIPPTPTRPPAMPAAPAPKISGTPIAAPVTPPSRPEPAAPTIFAALWDLAENWPEELRDEISRSALANASVPLAGNVVESGLKRGRLTMLWKQLRTLAKPSSTVSPNDGLELDLPLKVIAPLFFASQKNLASARKMVKVSADIPDLFFGFPQAAPEPPVSKLQPVDKKPADTNFYVWGDEGETPKIEPNVVSPPTAPQTDFMRRQVPPADVVSRALDLPGVAGALVTLPDGLRVASQVPGEFNADTLAAFIPQIFERLNQATRELRMGVLNNVNFTVGNVPWEIFRVSSVYFAAFGCAGEGLPTVQLAALAVELDRKKP